MMRFSFDAWDKVIGELQRERDRLVQVTRADGEKYVPTMRTLVDVEHALELLQRIWQTDERGR